MHLCIRGNVRVKEEVKMKYIVFLFFFSISLGILGIFFLIGDSFDSNRALMIIWILGSGAIISITYIALYNFLLSNFRKQMTPVNVHSYSKEISSFSLMLFISLNGLVLAISLMLVRGNILEKIAMAIVCLVAATLFINDLFNRIRREGFLALYFDKEGVHLKSFIKKEITIYWDDCIDVGIGTNPGINPHPTLYFSMDYLTENQLKKISKTKITNRFIRITYKEKVLQDILQYINKSRIRNYEATKEERKPF